MRTLFEAKNVALKIEMIQRRSFDHYKTTNTSARTKTQMSKVGPIRDMVTTTVLNIT